MFKLRKTSLHKKLILVIIGVGIIPIIILMFGFWKFIYGEYRESLINTYRQAVDFSCESIGNMLDSYNEISKVSYHYNYSSMGSYQQYYQNYENLHKIISGTGYDGEEVLTRQNEDMVIFLRNVLQMDNMINSVHFITDAKYNLSTFHVGRLMASRFSSEEEFQKTFDIQNLDIDSKHLILIPAHPVDYMTGTHDPVFTVARNYFDLTKDISRIEYVGTLLIDVALSRLDRIFDESAIFENGIVYIYDDFGNCFYSNREDEIGINVKEIEFIMNSKEHDFLIIESRIEKYQLNLMFIEKSETIVGKLWEITYLIGILILLIIVAVIGTSITLSKRLIHPLRNIMKQMERIESGDFNIILPTGNQDEIDTLSRRFNQMSEELSNYINRFYVAGIKQKEAELTALRAQIHPHFLYNTLEVIRMTAMENEDEQVSGMIEALSAQIHYVIGEMRDAVPLEKEIEITRKYIYLLNCRINETIELYVELNGNGKAVVPKFILQPLVENAYIHGFKPKGGNGSIKIEVLKQAGNLTIEVWDSGIGISSLQMEHIQMLLKSEEIGIRNEYDWQSIGLKNVHDRIRYLYGDDYGIELFSIPSSGTIIRIKIPIKEEI